MLGSQPVPSTAPAPHSWEGSGCWGFATQPLGTLLHSQIPNLWYSRFLQGRAGHDLSGAELGWNNSAPNTGESVELVCFQWSLNTANLAPFCCTNDENGVSHFYGIFIILLHGHTTMSVPLSHRDLLVLILLLIRCTMSK